MEQQIIRPEIIKIGKVENGVATGWHFNCNNTNVAGIVYTVGEGENLCAGYTIKELTEISSKNK